MTFDCSQAENICSLMELNEYNCSNNHPPGPVNRLPLCLGNGVNDNAGYFAFIGDGMPLQIGIEIDLGNCNFGFGLEVSVYEGDCSNGVIWDCDLSCGQNMLTLSGPTKKYQVYYMVVDGCNGDICPFRIQTSRQAPAITLPDSMGQIELLGDFCPGGRVHAVYSRFRDTCFPNYIWDINFPVSQDFVGDSISFEIPENAVPGTTITFELIVGIGNPNRPDIFCDSDTVTAISPPIAPIEKRYGPCKIICYEDQPIICNGGPISGDSCIIRGRPMGENCFVDSIFKFVLLDQPQMGFLDTLICGPTPFRGPDGNIYQGDICGDVIRFQRSVTSLECPGETALCDTSMQLYLLNYDYKSDLDIECSDCENKVLICPNVTPKTDCPYWDNRISIELEWKNALTGMTLGKTKGDGCLEVTTTGTYSYDVTATYQSRVCTSTRTELVQIDESYFYETKITGDTVICADSVGSYSIASSPTFCEAAWRVVGGMGTILTPNSEDSTTIRVKWGSLMRDTVLVCAEVETDCNRTEVCQQVAICPPTTSTGQTDKPYLLSYSPWTNRWSVKVPQEGRFTFELYNSAGTKIASSKCTQSCSLFVPGVPSGVVLGILKDQNGAVILNTKAIIP